jgi:hypothetical protein
MVRLSILLILFLGSCTYNPTVDHRGNKGKDVAFRYNDDLYTCRALAKENVPIYEPAKYVYNWTIRPQLLWLPDKWEYSYKKMVDNCMTNRGHSIITKE